MQVAPIANDHGPRTILPYNTSPLNASSINQHSARFGVPGFLEAGVQKVDMEVIAISFSTLVFSVVADGDKDSGADRNLYCALKYNQDTSAQVVLKPQALKPEP